VSGIQRLLSETHPEECLISPSSDDLKAGKWRLAANVLTRTQYLESRVHMVERLPSEGRGKPARYTPVRFVPKNKLGKDAKLLLAETTRTRRPGSRKKKKRTMVMMIAVPMVKMIVVMAMAMRRAAVVVLLPVVRRWTWWWRMITATARRETKEATALTREVERGRQRRGAAGGGEGKAAPGHRWVRRRYKRSRISLNFA